MCNNFPNIKVVKGNAFALLMPLKKRTFESCEPIDEDIDATQLTDLVVKFGGVQYQASTSEDGVQIIIPADIAVGTYSIVLTAMYQGSAIRAAYESAVTIVDYNSQSDAQQYIAGSPIVLDAAYVIGGTLTDAELEALKEEYREKNAQLQQAIEDAEEAKAEWEQKAADLDGVAQEATSQSILTAVENIDIDTSDLAKEATLGTPLVGQPSTIFAAIAQSGQDSKQTIVDAINQMGGSATADMTWAQLAAQIEELNVIAPTTIFNSNMPKPISIGYLIAVMPKNGVEEIYDTYTTSASSRVYFLENNSTIKKITYLNLESTPASFGEGCSNLKKAILPRVTSMMNSSFRSCVNLNVLDVSGLNTSLNYLIGSPNVIDLIIGGAFTGNFSIGNFSPSNCWLTTSSSLCFDTDLEEYGRTFLNNFEKWKWCIINHWAANLQDRTGVTAFTITFGSTVLSHFDAEMIAAFTDKNWTLA